LDALAHRAGPSFLCGDRPPSTLFIADVTDAGIGDLRENSSRRLRPRPQRVAPTSILTSLPRTGECTRLPAAPSTPGMSVKPPDYDGLTAWKATIVALMLVVGCILVVAGVIWLTQP
jgi:hypothetical protein